MERFIPTPFSDPADNRYVRMANAGNGSEAECIDNMPLAMAYVPMQKWNTTYDDAAALDNGTIFPELNLPFTGKGDGN